MKSALRLTLSFDWPGLYFSLFGFYLAEHLKDRLDRYIEQFNGKVRLVRNNEREGLIRTRSIGAQHAVGDVVIFLDAHCEVNINWLPPLLAPIRRNRWVFCHLELLSCPCKHWHLARRSRWRDEVVRSNRSVIRGHLRKARLGGSSLWCVPKFLDFLLTHHELELLLMLTFLFKCTERFVFQGGGGVSRWMSENLRQ